VPGRFVSITGKVNVARAVTFYTRTADWFAWLCVAMFIVLLASRFLARSLLGKETSFGSAAEIL
jgi:apolipoprotein N-acyltransferase